ncbi:MAG: tRNA lysidine(34) synthetase TilS [Melioribacteraceae bacterium]|nr:tRNA lysidine(34) synthetase TilS [Melioribacteraceae bacterium]
MSNNLQSYSTILETTLSKTTAKVWANKKLKLAALNKFDNELTNEIIKRGLEKYYDSKINSNDIEKVKKLVNSQVGKKIKLRKNFIALRERETIIIYKEESEKFSEVKLKPGETVVVGSQKISIEKINKSEIKWNLKGIEYISIDDENPIFTIRNWKSGDKFKPLGMNSFKKVSDFLTDLKIPSLTKKTKFLLEYRNQIVWIIGLRIDERFKITSSSKRIYKLCQQ